MDAPLSPVPCPACFNAEDAILNSDGHCRYCDGSELVTEVAALEWEIALLQVKNTKLAAECQGLRNEMHAMRQLVDAARRWRMNPCERTERALATEVDHHDDVRDATGKAA